MVEIFYEAPLVWDDIASLFETQIGDFHLAEFNRHEVRTKREMEFRKTRTSILT